MNTPGKLFRYGSKALGKLASLDKKSFLRLFADSGDAVVPIVDTPNRMLVDLEDPIMSRSLLMTGVYEPHVTRIFRENIKADSTILDIGANVGYFSLLGASLAGKGRVFAFEPDPRNYQRLMANVYLNGLQGRVRCENAAVADKDGEILLTNLDASNSGGRLTVDKREEVDSLFGKDFASLPVRSLRLDSFLKDERVDFIKIDIEGYEPKAFAGLSGILSRWHPAIVSEFSPDNLLNIGKTRPEEFLASFLRLGYAISAVEFESGKLIDCGSDPVRIVKHCRDLGVDHIDIFMKAGG